MLNVSIYKFWKRRRTGEIIMLDPENWTTG
jgi:hypothetical protein